MSGASSSSQQMSMGVSSQIDQAEVFKTEGNAYFKAGEYKSALTCYHKVFLYVNGLGLPGQGKDMEAQAEVLGAKGSIQETQVPTDRVKAVVQLKISTNLNMGLCYLKQGKYRRCIDACTAAIALDPSTTNSKAYFRRGQANVELRNLDEAQVDLDKAHSLEPNDPNIRAELRRLKAAFTEHETREKKRFAKMFDKMAQDAPAEEAPPAKASDVSVTVAEATDAVETTNAETVPMEQ